MELLFLFYQGGKRLSHKPSHRASQWLRQARIKVSTHRNLLINLTLYFIQNHYTFKRLNVIEKRIYFARSLGLQRGVV